MGCELVSGVNIMSTHDVSDETKGKGGNGRNPTLILAGFIILGVAVAVVLFGNNLFGDSETAESEVNAEAPILEQVPSFAEAEIALPDLPTGGGPLAIGDLAYDFALQDANGNAVQLSQLIGQPVILNFWATWCAPCRVEMPELQATLEARQDEGLVILALNQQEATVDVQTFFDDLGLTFTPLMDTEGSVSELYGVANILPTTFFINSDGEITAIHRGPMVKSQIDGYLAETIPSG
jgi:peroxiredoxin